MKDLGERLRRLEERVEFLELVSAGHSTCVETLLKSGPLMQRLSDQLDAALARVAALEAEIALPKGNGDRRH